MKSKRKDSPRLLRWRGVLFSVKVRRVRERPLTVWDWLWMGGRRTEVSRVVDLGRLFDRLAHPRDSAFSLPGRIGFVEKQPDVADHIVRQLKAVRFLAIGG